MSINIRVRDFQSIKDAEIIVDKFTVVTGPNNSGKTAVSRAFTGVFSNPGGDAYVRHGAEKFSVEVKFDDGNIVRWEKGPKTKPAYILNGKTIHPGRTVPEEVLALGVHPIPAGSGTVWPQVARQMTGQVFLLDMPGSAIAEAVADVNRVGKLTQALRFAESDKRSATSDLKVRRQDVVDVGVELAGFDGLDEAGQEVQAVEAACIAAASIQAEITEADGCREQLRKAEAVLAGFDGFDKTCVPPENKDAFPTGKALNTAQGLKERLSKAQTGLGWFNGFDPACVPPENKDASITGKALSTAQGLKNQITAGQNLVSRLSGIRSVQVPVPPTETLVAQTSLQEARSLKRSLQTAGSLSDMAQKVLADIKGLDLIGMGTLAEKAQKVEKAHHTYVQAQDSIAQNRKEISTLRTLLSQKQDILSEVQGEVQEILNRLGLCPVCKSPTVDGHPHD